MPITIRPEEPRDFRLVEEITREAFWNLHVPGCSEHFITHLMRNHADFIKELDFVAELDGAVVGSIQYTIAKVLEDNGKVHEAICFGPVSVLPAFQGRGIGSMLIKNSLEKARQLGYTAVLIFGNPAYYSRFGFEPGKKYGILRSDGKYARALQALELVPGALSNVRGRFLESKAFEFDEKAFEAYEKSFPFKEKLVTPSQQAFMEIASDVEEAN